MGLTYNNAIGELQVFLDQGMSGEPLENELKRIINELDVTDTSAIADAKTILYSGMDKDTVSKLANNPKNRILDNTDASKFLNIDENKTLQDTLEKIYPDSDWNTRGTEANNFLNGVDGNPRTPGAWDTISENFVANTKGDVITLIGNDASPERVFFQTELDTIRNTNNLEITSINGIQKDTFLDAIKKVSNKTVINTFKIDTQARKIISPTSLEIVTNKQIQNIYEYVGKDTTILSKKNELISYITDKGESFRYEFTTGTNIRSLSYYFNKLGPIGAALGFGLATVNAISAYNEGNEQKAKDIMTQFVVDEVGSIIGGSFGATVGGVAIGLFTLGGLTIAAPVAIAVIAVASIAGAFAGSELATYLYNEFDDIYDKMYDFTQKLSKLPIEILMDIIQDIDHVFDFIATQIKMADPLVLDTNKDGFISTIALEDSNAYFNISGDQREERVGWIKPEDALLVYDKNENNQIDGFSEVFGNENISGFDELRYIADSNNDGKIDRQDELYSKLQTWHDYNGDGKLDEGELKSLKEEGVSSINLDVFSTNIELNGNILTEASKYTDSENNQ